MVVTQNFYSSKPPGFWGAAPKNPRNLRGSHSAEFSQLQTLRCSSQKIPDWRQQNHPKSSAVLPKPAGIFGNQPGGSQNPPPRDGDPVFWGRYLRSMSEPFGDESERKAPGGGPLSWGGHGAETPPGDPKNPLVPQTPLLLHPAGGRSGKSPGNRRFFGGDQRDQRCERRFKELNRA